MTTITAHFPPGRRVPCPQCGQTVRFRAKSARVSADCCEVWLECMTCGCDPHGPGEKLEDVWGDLTLAHVDLAAVCWDEAAKKKERREA